MSSSRATPSGPRSRRERTAAKLSDTTVELAVPGVSGADTELPLPELWEAVKKVLPKTLAGLIAAGALAFNLWFSGILDSGQPLSEWSLKYIAIVLVQAVVVSYIVVISNALAVDVAGGVLAGTIVIVGSDVAGAFRGAFDVGQLVGQLVISYFIVAVLAFLSALVKAQRAGGSAAGSSALVGPDERDRIAPTT